MDLFKLFKKNISKSAHTLKLLEQQSFDLKLKSIISLTTTIH